MEVHIQPPSGEWGKVIHQFWYCSSPLYEAQGLTFPLPYPELVINLSDAFSVTAQNRAYTSKGQSMWLCGLQTKPVFSAANGMIETLGVHFTPWGLTLLTGIHAGTLVDQLVPAQQVLGTSCIHLPETLRQATTPVQKLEVLETYFQENFTLSSPTMLEQAIIQEWSAGMPASTAAVSRKLGISQKTLIAKINKLIGLPPQKYQQIISLARVLNGMSTNPESKLTNTAYQHGFYDQSHFIKRFKDLTSLTPKEYRRLVQLGKITEASPHHYPISEG